NAGTAGRMTITASSQIERVRGVTRRSVRFGVRSQWRTPTRIPSHRDERHNSSSIRPCHHRLCEQGTFPIRSCGRIATNAERDNCVAAKSPPQVLREYAVLADGERGAVLGPRGVIVWLCAPAWDSD